MSMIRQIWLVLAASLLLAVLGTTAVNLASAGSYLQAQLQQKNNDNAATLALAMSQQHGDVELMKLLLSAQFDAGSYRSIRLLATDGSVTFKREAPAATRATTTIAPDWFVTLTGIAPDAGVAQVSDGWKPLGTVEVTSTTSYAYDELWKSSVRAALALAAVGVLAGALGTWVLRRIGRALDATVAQAGALTQGEFISVPEPRVPELARLTQAMNSMVARLKTNFDTQSAELQRLHQLADCDPLTELANRAAFLRQLRATLEREDGPAHGGLVLLRLADLAGLNQTLGRDRADRLLKQIALALRPYGERVDGCIAGRLNGADFALYVPVSGMVLETAQTLMQILANSLASHHAQVGVAAGALEVRHGMSLSEVMAGVDAALARAEGLAPFNVHLGSGDGAFAEPAGEGAWRERLEEALSHGRAKLVSFPLINAEQNLVHLESPLRLQLESDGEYQVAAAWLPLAARSRLTAAADQRAVALALDGITEDGLPRCVNVSAASLSDSGFAARLRALMFGGPQAARRLWIEVPEAAAIEQFALVQELGRQLRPCGVRIGIEHASAKLRQVDRLLELGLDFVKLDASAVGGVAGDLNRARFVRGMAAMLHGLSISVYAEGVTEAEDAKVLWGCGIDGITGPVASERRRDLVQS